MVQFCCGTGDCTAAGANPKRGIGNTYTSAVIMDTAGDVVVPLEVGDLGGDMMDVFMKDYGLNNTSVRRTISGDGTPVWKIGYGAEEELDKRDCDTYTPAQGAPYTNTDTVSTRLTGRICGDGSMTTITNEQSVSRSTTFEASVSDPFGIISASIEFTTEMTATQSYDYTFTAPNGQCGQVVFTATLLCTSGTISGCDDGDQEGEACTANRVSDSQIDETYSFVITD